MTTNYLVPNTKPINGNVFHSFEKINEIFAKNDGRRYYRELESSCYDSDTPYFDDKQTHLRITNPAHDVNQLGDTYIKRKVKATLVSNKAFTCDAAFKCMRLFVGYKSSNQSFKQLEVETERGDAGYLQMDCARESFAFATYKPKSERKVKKFVHSLYNNVQKYDNSVCGKYIDPSEVFKNANKEVDITFDMIIPVNDLLAFQAFDDYPKSFGDIILKYYVFRDTLVFCQVDPLRVADLQNYVYEKITDENYEKIMNHVYKYDRKFQQIGLPAKLITSLAATSADATVDDVIISCTKMEVLEDKCITPGYGLIEESVKAIPRLFSKEDPFMIPAQHIDVRSLNGGCITPEGISSDFSYALHNVTDVVLTFPKNAMQRTVLENPMLRGLQVTIDSRNFPDQAMTTVGDIFFTRMLQASDLDGVNECTEEYEDSLTRPLNADDGTPLARTWKDQTSFLCTIPVQRDGAGIFFDGLETFNSQVTVQVKAYPIIQGENDTYCSKVTNPPQVWFTRTTYWTWTPDEGLKYHPTGTPPQYRSSYDEILMNRNV
ncbi:hypothetical protein TVAGG3_0372470 [Trichomonas vaginalis G3]|uniref:hypothetical protein n=4 Tax=Trichomonas vaginalis (strain ATCC PRA-98 / G3) TaxID=412133 RepID=UPI0021E58CE9|nr:hypothetical protein TVAGG3_0372470 [Trichomonas vaginalis G3]KAI5532697.1 hypothetical protein TVAGG3_0372470 [Trichomonas vaginalis G3]